MSSSLLIVLAATLGEGAPGEARADPGPVEPVHAIDLDERLMGMSLLDDGSGIRAIVRHQRRAYAFDGTLTASVDFSDAFRSVARSRDGRLLIHDTHPVDTRLVVWDLKENEIVGRAPDGVFVQKPVRFLKDDGSEAVARVGREIRRFAIPSFRTLATYAVPKEEKVWFKDFHVTPAGRLLALYARNVNYQGQPGGVLVWDVKAEREVVSLKLNRSPWTVGAAADGRWLVVATHHRVQDVPVYRTRLFDAAKPDPETAWDLGESREVPTIAFSPDGTRLAVVDAARNLVLYDGATRKELFRVRLHRRRILRGPVRFTADGGKVVVGYNVDTRRRGPWDWAGRIRVFDVPGA